MLFGFSGSLGGSGGGIVPVEAFIESHKTGATFGGIPDSGIEGKIGGAEGVNCTFGSGVGG